MSKIVPTIRDVSIRAGVSSATVSRALSQPHLLRKKTLKRVEQAIEDTGYIVNEAARSLRSKKTGILLAMISATPSQFFSKVLLGVEKIASKLGYGILIANTQDDAAKIKQLYSYIQKNRADGILIFGGKQDIMQNEVVGSLPPIIAVNEKADSKGIPFVTVDNFQSAKTVTRHLFELGHRQIGHIAGPTEYASSSIERRDGFLNALNGTGVEPFWILNRDFNIESGFNAAEEWMKLDLKPTAVFCSCDEVALGFISKLHLYGFRIPEDVSVVGFDDIPFAEISTPPLTTICQPHIEIGTHAVNMLLEQIRQPEIRQDSIHLPGSLIIRGSTKPL